MSKNTYSVPINIPEKLLEQMLYGRQLTDAESIFINNLKDWLEDIHAKVLEENKDLKTKLERAQQTILKLEEIVDDLETYLIERSERE